MLREVGCAEKDWIDLSVRLLGSMECWDIVTGSFSRRAQLHRVTATGLLPSELACW
jgi:hypothetical protein